MQLEATVKCVFHPKEDEMQEKSQSATSKGL